MSITQNVYATIDILVSLSPPTAANMKVFVILVCCLVSNVVSVQEKRSMESSQNGKSSPLLWMIINQLYRLETKMNKIQGEAETRQKQMTEVNTRINKIQDKIQKENSVLNAKISVLETEVRKLIG